MLDRLKALEDRLEIERLMALYARHGDKGWAEAGGDTRALAHLFTEDGVWESGATMRLEGPAAIAAGLDAAPVRFVVHLFLSPVITVKGDEAEGDWRAVLMLTGADGQARWGVSAYRVRYSRSAAGWRIAHLRAGAIAWAASAPFDIAA